MKRDHYCQEAANAGGGTSNIPFYELVAPNRYAGEVVATVLLSVFNTAKRGVTALNRWRWERITRSALENLDNATLVDIGVARSEIPAVARAAAEHPTFTPMRRSRWTV